jgi:hypothetical protein
VSSRSRQNLVFFSDTSLSSQLQKTERLPTVYCHISVFRGFAADHFGIKTFLFLSRNDGTRAKILQNVILLRSALFDILTAVSSFLGENRSFFYQNGQRKKLYQMGFPNKFLGAFLLAIHRSNLLNVSRSRYCLQVFSAQEDSRGSCEALEQSDRLEKTKGFK